MPEHVAAIGRYTPMMAARLVGVSPRRLGQWTRREIIPRTGRGATYTYADVGEALLAHYLIDYLDVSLPRVGYIVAQLREDYGLWPLATAPLEHDGPFVVVREGEAVLSTERPSQGVMEKMLDLRRLSDALGHGGWVTLAQPRPHVEVNPARLGGRPTVRDRRIPTELVADIAARAGGREVLQSEYELRDVEIDDALGYEQDVREALAA
jgi:uncharacterized protein (DUF433 family)